MRGENMLPRELVYKTLEFENKTNIVPRNLWLLPVAISSYEKDIERITKKYPDDIGYAPVVLKEQSIRSGDPYQLGQSTDEWGCKFNSINAGIMGEVHETLVKEEEWEDWGNIHIPNELLSIDKEIINDYCKSTDKFVLSTVLARPFEQLQFIRTTEQLYMDIMTRPPLMFKAIEQMHVFYCEHFEEWAKTDVDALFFMDDWGTQKSLLISPTLWREIFKPMYKDYAEIARRNNKKLFFHSDGHILDILPDLIEIGVDAINSQIFCIGIEKLQQFKGKITFWGEIDRQHILPFGRKEDVFNAVKSVKDLLWADGGCIAQCEFGPGATPSNVEAVFEAWSEF
jgi:hypothetical protein